MKRAAGSRWVAGLLVGALWVGLPGVRPALAQGAGAPTGAAAPAGAQGAGPASATSATDEEVARLYAEGITDVKEGQPEKGRELLEKAFRLKRFWKIAANLGAVEASLGKHRDAAEHLEFFLLNAPQDALSPEDRARAQEMLKASQKEVVRLTIMVDVQGAEVLVDGKPVGTSPLGVPVYVEPPGKGELLVEARKKGYRSEKEVVKAAKGTSHTVAFELKEGGGNSGSVGSSVGGGGGEGSENEVEKHGYSDPKKSDSRTAILVGGIVLSIAAAGVGVGFAVASNIKADDKIAKWPQKPTTCPAGCDYNELERSRATLSNVSFWSFVGAGAVGVGTAIFAVASSSKKQHELKAAVGVGPNEASIIVSSRW